MKAIIFGANGYLGRHLTCFLRETGHEVNIPMAEDSTILNLQDLNSLSQVNFDVDAVFMFAGATGTVISFDQYKKFLLANELSLLNVLDCIRRSSFRPRVIFPSTRLVYAGAEDCLPESGPKEFKTPYSINKIACEYYLQAYSGAFDIPFTIIRISVPYGNRLGGECSYGTVDSFIQQARNTGLINLYGGGYVRRTFSHVEDLCRITISAAVSPEAINGIFNMPGEDLSLREAAFLIAIKLGASLQDSDWPELDARIETGSTKFNSDRIESILNESIKYRFADWVNSIPSV